MIRRSISELHFIKGNSPCPTVEIQAEGLEVKGLHLSQIVSSVLTRFAAENPKVQATVYLYGTMSVNFHENAWSEFLIVAGTKRLLTLLLDAFSMPGIKARCSDHITPSQGIEAFHIEAGLLWEPEDAMSWYSSSSADEDGTLGVIDTGLPPNGDTLIDDDSPNDISEEALGVGDSDTEPQAHWPFPLVGSREAPARYRAARDDASVVAICHSIEKVFGLPVGSVALCGPDGRTLRGDAFIKTLRRRWKDA